jgi:regulatory protein
MPSAAAKRQPLSLKARALALLAQREQSISEIRRKLLRHLRATSQPASAGVLAAEVDPIPVEDDGEARVDEVIDWLRANNYLSEERFVESRVNARAGRYGNLRIRQELAQHGVVMTPEAAQALKDSELERAMEVWRKKFAHPPADAAEKARHARFLSQRGFSPDVISKVLRSARTAGTAETSD